MIDELGHLVVDQDFSEELAKLEAKRKRNSIQYMGIIIGIVVLFIALVMMGWFKVSAGTIRAIGFFSFLIFFLSLFSWYSRKISTA